MAQWSWKGITALVQRLQQPTAATLVAEYSNIRDMTSFLATQYSLLSDLQNMTQQPAGFTALMQQWCSIAKPLLLLLSDSLAFIDAPTEQQRAVFFGVGMLLSGLANLLESWVDMSADREAVKQQIAQQTAGVAPLLGKTMATIAAGISQNTARRHQKAANPESAQETAEAAHAKDYFPQHTDINTGLYLLSVWKGLAAIRPGKMLRTSRTSSSSSRRGGSSSSSGDLQGTVLPACDLAVSLLKTWPPNVAGSTAARSRGAAVLPAGSISRSQVSDLMFAVSSQLSKDIKDELLDNNNVLSTPDFKFAKQLSASAAVHHLLLLRVAFTCHLLHKQRRGLSPIKIKTAAAVVSGSRDLAAAAAAAEAAAGSNGSRGAKQQQQYLPVPAHHSTVCELLLVPAESLTVRFNNTTHCCVHLAAAIATVSQFAMGAYNAPEDNGLKVADVMGLRLIPLELCAPLHCMLAEAAVLDPEAPLSFLHAALVFLQALQEVYFKAKVGSPVKAAAVRSAVVGQSSALSASLLLMGPAVLNAYKHSDQGDIDLPAYGMGCPLGANHTPLKGASLRDATLNLFGSITVKIGALPDIAGVLTAAFQQRPFSTAAVCEAVVRGASRHNFQRSETIRMFASLSTSACCEVAAPPGGPNFSNTTAAAASDSNTRGALLVQLGLVLTQLKYNSSNCGAPSVFSGLFHHVVPSAAAAVKLGGIAEDAVGLEGVSSSIVEEQRVRVRTLQPWIHLTGRCLFFAGSQLLLALEDSAAARAAALDGNAVVVMQRVLEHILAVLQMVGPDVKKLQQLQPEGTCILQGPPEAAVTALQDLDNTLAAVTREWEGVWDRWKVVFGQREQALAQGQSSSNTAWGQQLQQMLQTAVGTQAAVSLRDAGAAVCVEFPVKLCCNNPGCGSMDKVGEMLLGSSCSGCKAARYCSKACQGAAWKMGHSKVCKRITKAAAAGAAGGAR